MAFFGSFNIFTIISLVSPCSVKIIGSRPINSGIIPNFLISSTVTLAIRFFSLSKRSLSCPLKPMELCFVRRSLIISSKSGKAPPQIKRILRVLIVASGTIAFLLFAPTGTSISAPSKSFSIPCCTDSPLTSRELLFFFFAILSISSIKMMPRSAFSTSLSAAAKSFDTTLSISSPIYPASVKDVASAMASGTSKSRASVFTR